MEHLEIDSALIEYCVEGSGEPVLLIAPSVVGDGSRPLLAEPQLASHFRLIHYHRRGYLGSTRGTKPLTASGQAADAASLLRHLGVKAAHIAGHSYGGLIALQLAVDAPDLVHTLALLEPAMFMVPSGKTSSERFLIMLNAYRAGEKKKAFDMYCGASFGPNWQTIMEHAIPGSVEQAVRDFDTFVEELPAIQEWQLGSKDAAAITKPVLSVRGTLNESPLMKEGRALLHSWFPQTEYLDVPTTHLLQIQDPKGVATGLAGFFSRHPMR